jgi:hypothetical protein
MRSAKSRKILSPPSSPGLLQHQRRPSDPKKLNFDSSEKFSDESKFNLTMGNRYYWDVMHYCFEVLYVNGPSFVMEAVNVVVNAFLEAGLDMMVHDRLHLQ